MTQQISSFSATFFFHSTMFWTVGVSPSDKELYCLYTFINARHDTQDKGQLTLMPLNRDLEYFIYILICRDSLRPNKVVPNSALHV